MPSVARGCDEELLSVPRYPGGSQLPVEVSHVQLAAGRTDVHATVDPLGVPLEVPPVVPLLVPPLGVRYPGGSQLPVAASHVQFAAGWIVLHDPVLPDCGATVEGRSVETSTDRGLMALDVLYA